MELNLEKKTSDVLDAVLETISEHNYIENEKDNF